MTTFGAPSQWQPRPQAPRPGEVGAPRDQFGGYGAPGRGGYTWGPDAANRFLAENPIDPTTGLPTGPGQYGLIPHEIALQYQAAHNTKIWELRQRMMRGGLAYGRGALNLQQSFRQGGGAAIEAGTYQGLMGGKFQQAAMTEPLDLLGDYRREQESQARMKSNRAAERQLAVQTIGTIGAIAAGFATGGAGFALLPALTAGMNAYGAHQNRQAVEASARAGYDNGQTPRGPSGPGGYNPQMPPGMSGPPMPPSGGAQGGPLPGTPGGPIGAPPPGGPQGLGASQSQLAPDQPQGGASSPGGQDQPVGSQQGQAGGAGGVGMGSPAVGADGNFTPVAYAMNGAATAQHPIQNALMMKQVADSVESDPFYPAFHAAVNARFAEMMVA